MDEFAVIILALIGILFILPIIAIVSATKSKNRVIVLTKELRDLKALVARLEARGLRASDDSQQATPVTPSEPDRAAEPVPEEEEEPAPETPPEDVEQIAPPPQGEPAERPQISLSMRDGAASVSGEPAPKRNVEQRLGTQWTVWVGGIALALGGIFLVRYSIEAGLLGPGVRVALGALFAAALVAAGEFIRRRDFTADLAGVPSAYIPGVLTAAGIMSAFATVYAAYALYGFLPPLIAFALLAACSFAALSASWLHGPGLAALGLLGSYVTPILVASDKPQAWPLFIYLLFVTGASFFVARLRGWLWLAVSAAVGAVLWGLIWCGGSWSGGDIIPLSFYILALTGLSFYFLAYISESETHGDGTDETTTPKLAELLKGTDPVAAGVLAAITFLVIPAIRLDGYGPVSLALLGITLAALIAGAWRWRNLNILLLWAALLFAAVYGSWHIPALVQAPLGPFDAYLDVASIAPPALWTFLATGVIAAIAFFVSGFLNPYLSRGNPLWTLIACVMPLAIFAYAYLRATRFEQDVPFGIAGLLIAFLYVAASEALTRKGDLQLWLWRAGCFAAAAVIGLGLAFTMLLEKGWLTIALALVCPGLGWVALKRPVPGLRYLAAGMAVVVMARLAWDPVIVGSNLGTTPILNWLLYGYGVPAIAFIAASRLFLQQKDDRAVNLLEAAGILCFVVLVGLQIRHALNGGNVYTEHFTLVEVAIHAISMLGLAIGLQRLYDRSGRDVVEWAGTIAGIAGLAIITLGLLLIKNPMETGEPIGEGRIFNDLLLAYLVPALLCGILFILSQGRHKVYVMAAGGAALVLLLAFISLEVRAFYHGSILTTGRTTDAEWYTYSAVWLLYGVALLGAGIVTGQAALRYASLAIIILTVAKVFLSDLANLEGILRALSFIGLGLVLVGIGYFYQRFVFPLRGDERENAPAPAPDSGENGGN